MQAVIYYLFLPFIYLISILPLWLLYRVSDSIYILAAFLIRYRKQVILTNLKNSFPEKTSKELRKICNSYYKFLCDVIFETLKSFTMSKKQRIERCNFSSETIALLNRYYNENKSIIVTCGHLGNWEWVAQSLAKGSKYPFYVVYKPLSNKYFDRLMYKIRTKNEIKLIPMKETYRKIVNNKNTITATVLVADQTPAPDSAHWATFLNQDTPIFLGAERISKKLNYPVFFLYTKRIKRGYYKMYTEKLFDEPKLTKEGEISEAYINQLEEAIKKQPEIWLWSHRRWKHTRDF